MNLANATGNPTKHVKQTGRVGEDKISIRQHALEQQR